MLKLVDFRYVLRQGHKVLQARHRKVYDDSLEGGVGLHMGAFFMDMPDTWGEWEDVPLVKPEE